MEHIKKYSIGIICFLSMSSIAYAEVRVSEIAWMGTANSQYEEWFELENTGEVAVDLSGWKMYKAVGATVLFSLGATIAPNSFYVACRTTGTLTNPLDGLCNESGPFGGSGMNNTSEHLILKDGTGTVIQEINATSGWPAGDATTKYTMQWDGAAWVTAQATPGQGYGGSSSTEDDDETETTETTTTNTTTSETTKPKVKEKQIRTYTLTPTIPAMSMQGLVTPFRTKIFLNKIYTLLSGRIVWTMGDGAVYQQFKNRGIDHVYEYPGTYAVTLEYYSNTLSDEPEIVVHKKITIVPQDVLMDELTDDEGIILANETTYEIDLQGWQIRSGMHNFSFPRYTMLAKQSIMPISSKRLGFAVDVGSQAELVNPSGNVVATYTGVSISDENQVMGASEERDDPAESVDDTVPAPEKPLIYTIPEQKIIQSEQGWWRWHFFIPIGLVIGILAYFGFRLYARKHIL